MAGEATIWNPRNLLLLSADTKRIEQQFTAITGQTQFTITDFAYALNTGALAVYVNGKIIKEGINWVENTDTTFSLVAPSVAGDVIIAVGFVGITANVDVRDTDIFVSNYQAIRDYAGTEITLYAQGAVIGGDEGESFFHKKTGAAPGTHVDDNEFTLRPTGGDGSIGWVRSTRISKFPRKVDSIAAAQLLDFSNYDRVETAAFFGGFVNIKGPRGGRIYHRDGLTGTPSTIYSNNSGFFDADGKGFRINLIDVNVYDFGAVGGGVTDDTTEVGFATDSGAGEVYFPADTFLCNINPEVTVKLRGAGKEVTFINNASAGTPIPAVLLQATQVLGASSIDFNATSGDEITSATTDLSSFSVGQLLTITQTTNNNRVVKVGTVTTTTITCVDPVTGLAVAFTNELNTSAKILNGCPLGTISDMTLNNQGLAANTLGITTANCSVNRLQFREHGNSTGVFFGLDLVNATLTRVDDVLFADNDLEFGGHLNIVNSFDSVLSNIVGGRAGTSVSQFAVRANAAHGVNFHGLYMEEGGGNGLIFFTSCQGLSVQGLSSELFASRNPLVGDKGFIRMSACRGCSISGGFISHQTVSGTPVPVIHLENSDGCTVEKMYVNRSINSSVDAIQVASCTNTTVQNITGNNVVSTTDATPVTYDIVGVTGGSGIKLDKLNSISNLVTVSVSSSAEIDLGDVPGVVHVGANLMPVGGVNVAVLASAGAQSNITGDTLTHTISFNTEIFDNLGDHNGGTTFTAVVTGQYAFDLIVGMSGLTAAMTFGQISIVTSNRTYVLDQGNYAAMRTVAVAANELTVSGSILADMDAGDTATFTLLVDGGAGDTVDLSSATFMSAALRK